MREYSEVSCKTSDGVGIKYNAYINNNDTALFILPGWFMTKDSKAFRDISRDFAEFYNVYTLDLRGHGKSSGLYTFSADEVKDLRAVIEHVKSDKDYRRYLLMGFSLGGAIAINYTAQYKDINGLIAVSAPTSLKKTENHFWKKEAYIPTFRKFEFERWISIRPSLIFKKMINPIDVIKDISPIPVYFIGGQNDKTVYPWHAKSLYEHADEPKKLTIFDNTIHAEDIYIASPTTFVNSCYNWYEYMK